MILLKEPGRAEHLFRGSTDTLVWSCLSGVMGSIYTDQEADPISGVACLGDFCFFGGKPDAELVRDCPGGDRGYQILVPEGSGWASLIEECWSGRAEKVTRYAFQKEPDVWDRSQLRRAVQELPEGFELRQIDGELFARARAEAWSRDWTAQFTDYAQYRRYGAGVAALKDGALVSGASAYSAWPGGIEIEIDTHPSYQRRGLAYCCAAALILLCTQRGLYPSWDAHNPASAALACKLGYHPQGEYTAYELRRP